MPAPIPGPFTPNQQDALPLLAIFDDVVTLFASEGTTANIVFGRREPTKQINQGTGRANRVVFVPGVDGKMGKYSSAVRPGRNPRPLKTLEETAHVYVWAYDATNPNDERLQYDACMRLHDAVIRAIELSVRTVGHGNVAALFSALERVGAPVERTFGFEVRFVLTVQHAIPDTTYPEVIARDDSTIIMAFPPSTDTYNDGDELVEPGP